MTCGYTRIRNHGFFYRHDSLNYPTEVLVFVCVHWLLRSRGSCASNRPGGSISEFYGWHDCVEGPERTHETVEL